MGREARKIARRTVSLLESRIEVPRANIEALNLVLPPTRGKFDSIDARVRTALDELGWQLQSEDDDLLVYSVNPGCFAEEANDPASIEVHDRLSVFRYGALLRPGSFLLYRNEDGRQLFRLEIRAVDHNGECHQCLINTPLSCNGEPVVAECAVAGRRNRDDQAAA